MHLVQDDDSSDEQQSGKKGAEPRYKCANGSVRRIHDALPRALTILARFSQRLLPGTGTFSVPGYVTFNSTYREQKSQALLCKVRQSIRTI